MAGASNESGVVDDGNFWRFECYFFRIFREKASNDIMAIYYRLPLVGRQLIAK